MNAQERYAASRSICEECGLPMEACNDMTVLRLEVQRLRRELSAERERCAQIASKFSFAKPRLHPDVSWEDTNDGARHACHITAQEIAAMIRATPITTEITTNGQK